MKFNKLLNNCFFLELGSKIVLISYESIIGVIVEGVLYISEYYIGYSKTTSKHLNNFRKNLKFNNEVIIDNNQLYKLVNNI